MELDTAPLHQPQGTPLPPDSHVRHCTALCSKRQGRNISASFQIYQSEHFQAEQAAHLSRLP